VSFKAMISEERAVVSGIGFIRIGTLEKRPSYRSSRFRDAI